MAITINGSGTIGGVSVGGLPDGIVTASDLASTLDLTGKTVTLPTGTGGNLLQGVTTQLNTSTTGSATWASATYGPPRTLSGTVGNKFLEASITPLSSSSTIVIMAFCSAAAESANHSTYLGCGIWKNNTGSPLVANYFNNTNQPIWPYSVNGANSGSECIVQMFTESSASTTSRTYSWYCGVDSGAVRVNGAGSGDFYTGSTGSCLLIWELA